MANPLPSYNQNTNHKHPHSYSEFQPKSLDYPQSKNLAYLYPYITKTLITSTYIHTRIETKNLAYPIPSHNQNSNHKHPHLYPEFQPKNLAYLYPHITKTLITNTYIHTWIENKNLAYLLLSHKQNTNYNHPPLYSELKPRIWPTLSPHITKILITSTYIHTLNFNQESGLPYTLK
jgi:hypothetical protein